jgi:hypothetical protein
LGQTLFQFHSLYSIFINHFGEVTIIFDPVFTIKASLFWAAFSVLMVQVSTLLLWKRLWNETKPIATDLLLLATQNSLEIEYHSNGLLVCGDLKIYPHHRFCLYIVGVLHAKVLTVPPQYGIYRAYCWCRGGYGIAGFMAYYLLSRSREGMGK